MIHEALSEEEWENGYKIKYGSEVHWNDGMPYMKTGLILRVDFDGYRQQVAAVCLRDQEFGFTWEMVDALRKVYSMADSATSAAEMMLADEAIDRIEALLPPREEP